MLYVHNHIHKIHTYVYTYNLFSPHKTPVKKMPKNIPK